MFKFLIRRIRYLLANKTLRGVRILISTALLLLLAFFIMGGGVNQRDTFINIAKFFYDSAYNLSEKIKEGDLPLEITDQGIYMKEKGLGNKINIFNKNKNEKLKEDKNDNDIKDEVYEQDEDIKEKSEENKN